MESNNQGMVDCLQMNGYGERRYRFIASFFSEKKGRLLDIGCCEGGMRRFLNEDLAYYGIDNSENEFENFTRVDLNSKELPFQDKMFDAVNCSATLEHLLYPGEMLREIKRILKDDGCALISLPNDKSLNALYAQLFLAIPSYEDQIFGHHWRFSIETARKFFENDFKIVKEVPEFGPLFRKYLPFLKINFLCTEWFMLGVKAKNEFE